jgi:hypothetical protein
MKRLIASAVLLSVTLVATALFIGTSSSALAAGTLTVDKPNYTDYGPLVAGMTYFIQWTPGNAGATVKIELLKAGKRTKWVTTKTANDGEFIWKIPKSVKKNSKYKIKITSTKNSSIYDRSDDTFTIYNASNWWKEDFEFLSVGIEDDGSGTWGHFWVHGNNPHNRYALDVVNKKDRHPVRKGKQSIRFEVRPGQCGGGDCGTNQSERVELSVGANEYTGKNYWYAWSVYFKNFRPIDPVSPTVGQFRIGRVPTAIEFTTFLASSNGLEAFFTIDRKTKSYRVVPYNQLSNKWHDILVNAKWSTGADGFFKIWWNGKLQVNHKGRNVIDRKNDRLFRFGLYRSNMYRKPGNKITHIVYYDEVMRGNSCEDVSQFMTCPGGGSLKVTSPNGKEKWKTKKKYTIKWKKGKAGTYVKIQLLKKGKLYKTIAAKTKNDGKHAWRVPSTLVKSAAYKVKITSTKNKKLTDSSNNHFTITK